MPFFKRDRKNANGLQGKPPSQPPGSVSNQATWGVQGNTAPIGWSPSSGAAPQAPPMRVNLPTPMAPNQPSDPAGGFVHPGISPSPVSATRPGNISHPGGFAPQVQPPIVPHNVRQDESYSWFVAIDQDGSGEISPEELRNALMKDGGLKFSLPTVKYLMSIFDLDNSRGIGFQEFESLWKFINQWKQMFESFDVNRDGKIDADELGRALAHYDFRVGLPVLDILVKKYAIAPPPSRGPHYGPPARPQIDLDHFVCACIVVRQMCQLYDQCSGYGQAPISRDDFIRAVITLP
ncbi:hypothetical protein EDB83DRAFT_2677154 [Lactarius deliciosus]|nr:hypothetical protein EDB83DRAFT_2677154 [Lactarius deliciosus]